ncbi:hypothetical protein U8326_00055 [Tsuneonella sp. CC-YZS046]|uniref:hypothetical protein n=1 Tax=Tsuneonella sp. CC-YZS046 TaxID=3042152 RepID=UPI002D79B37B|nr:hypothetical protein [Tsuneonella sp. CC-YZS046]WRO66597.1 hypothetical protein U8326_00055 [Tsuneonella sp. CC-YZS046]
MADQSPTPSVSGVNAAQAANETTESIRDGNPTFDKANTSEGIRRSALNRHPSSESPLDNQPKGSCEVNMMSAIRPDTKSNQDWLKEKREPISFHQAKKLYEAALERTRIAGEAHAVLERILIEADQRAPEKKIRYKLSVPGVGILDREVPHTLKPHDCERPSAEMAGHPDFPEYCEQVEAWRQSVQVLRTSLNADAIELEWEAATKDDLSAWKTLAASKVRNRAEMIEKIQLCRGADLLNETELEDETCGLLDSIVRDLAPPKDPDLTQAQPIEDVLKELAPMRNEYPVAFVKACRNSGIDITVTRDENGEDHLMLGYSLDNQEDLRRARLDALTAQLRRGRHRRKDVIALLNMLGHFADNQPYNSIAEAANEYLAAGGRIMVRPDGGLEETIPYSAEKWKAEGWTGYPLRRLIHRYRSTLSKRGAREAMISYVFEHGTLHKGSRWTVLEDKERSDA